MGSPAHKPLTLFSTGPIAGRLAYLGTRPCAYPDGHPLRLRGHDASGRARTRSSQSHTPALNTAIVYALAAAYLSGRRWLGAQVAVASTQL
eukprot:6553115-Prymnesium_polylepis.1